MIDAMKISYKVDTPENFSTSEKATFLELLKVQGKVVSPNMDRINACKFLGLVFENGSIVAIAALKPQTKSVFFEQKANIPNESTNFSWEIGYCYTIPAHTGKGHCSDLAEQILKKVPSQNLMASTEIHAGNPMLKILEKNGFVRAGNTWQSAKKGGGKLALFLKK